VLQKKLMVMS